MRKLITIFSCLFIVVQFFSGCTDEKNNAKSMEQLYKENGVPVKVETIKKVPIVIKHTYHAVLTGIKESKASAKVSDKVEKIYFSVGDHVKKDQVIISFPIDNPAAQYNQAKVSFEHARATLKRMQDLYKNGGISLQEFENTRTQFEVVKANWEAVKQFVKVQAPISGIITQINVQESDNVKPGDPLFTISQTYKLKSKFWVSESEIKDIHKGDSASATWGDITIKGRVIQVDLSLNAKKQAFGVAVEFDNSQKQIQSGVNAEITIQGDGGGEGILIGRKNLVRMENKNIVFVATNGIAKEREITIGKSIGLDVKVVKGLNPGDLLITEGQLLLKNGDKIRIINQS
ncbi:MAG: efflux RND transporter periplasmic adaptor subunit [Calditrichaeota bacterium]|nr:efflux RND transporter periplasmic adaptor subunit [Calditrichota bacterium]